MLRRLIFIVWFLGKEVLIKFILNSCGFMDIVFNVEVEINDFVSLMSFNEFEM